MPGEKILLVEDNDMNMLLSTELLHFAGYEVIQAGTAEEGIKLARAQAPRLILMDIALPGMDGLTATRLLRNDPATRGIPVVALTAHAMKGDKERALAAGCLGYITKPIEVADFASTVARFIADADRAAGEEK